MRSRKRETAKKSKLREWIDIIVSAHIPTETGRHFRRKADGGLRGTWPGERKGSRG